MACLPSCPLPPLLIVSAAHLSSGCLQREEAAGEALHKLVLGP